MAENPPARGTWYAKQVVTRSTTNRYQKRVGQILRDKWHLDELIGVGGNAAVYSATHRNGKRAAVKVLHPECATSREVVTRFLREGYVANRLEHSGAVSIIDDDRTDDGTVFLVMELLTGWSLATLTRSQPMPLGQALRVVDDVLDVLVTAHGQGILHRDIKPGNLFLTDEGQVKVLDFGIARLREIDGESFTLSGVFLGTPAYMAPEQARGRWNLVDERTDLWSLGATLITMLTCKKPREAGTVNEQLLFAMVRGLPSLAEIIPGAPGAVVSFVDRAVAFERDARFPDARSMQAEVRALRQNLAEPSKLTLSMPRDALDHEHIGPATLQLSTGDLQECEPSAPSEAQASSSLEASASQAPSRNAEAKTPTPMAPDLEVPVDVEPTSVGLAATPALTTSTGLAHDSHPLSQIPEFRSRRDLVIPLIALAGLALLLSALRFLVSTPPPSPTVASMKAEASSPRTLATEPPSSSPPASAPPEISAQRSATAVRSSSGGPKPPPSTSSSVGTPPRAVKGGRHPSSYFEERY